MPFYLIKNKSLLNSFLTLPKPDLFVLKSVTSWVSIQRRPKENQDILRYKKEKLSEFLNKYFEDRLIIMQGNEKLNSNIKELHIQNYKIWLRKIDQKK